MDWKAYTIIKSVIVYETSQQFYSVLVLVSSKLELIVNLGFVELWCNAMFINVEIISSFGCVSATDPL